MRALLLVALLAVPAVAQTAGSPLTLDALRARQRAAGGITELRIEIDYMVERGSNGQILHSHEPTAAEIDAVQQMFACQGITLFVAVDDAVVHADVLRRDPDDADNFFDYDDGQGTFAWYKDQYFDRGGDWHYAIFGHQYQDEDYEASGSSGLGERPGDDFVVTLGDFDGEVGTPWDRASTLAHEFGHNLGLGHAGGMSPGTVGTRVPNLPSIMTYFSQLQGIRTALQCYGLISEDPGETRFKELDFSHGRACFLNEGALSEPLGMGIVPVDWSCDGDATDASVSQDVGEQRNGWCGSTASLDVLFDFDEWSAIVDVAALAPGSYVSEDVSCVTADEIEAFRASFAGGCPQPTPAVESCGGGRMHYLGDSSNLPTGTCGRPFRSLAEAASALDDDNVIYAQPGSYPTTGTVIDQPVQILGPGGVVFGD